ncbi:MAG: hypothetical protein KatS3mg023_3355 [Armatimonadota bacterium]|nr:MAG: hypothetical protein KatS3mg023_3355 [Armatimonadota bacterium]
MQHVAGILCVSGNGLRRKDNSLRRCSDTREQQRSCTSQKQGNDHCSSREMGEVALAQEMASPLRGSQGHPDGGGVQPLSPGWLSCRPADESGIILGGCGLDGRRPIGGGRCGVREGGRCPAAHHRRRVGDPEHRSTAQAGRRIGSRSTRCCRRPCGQWVQPGTARGATSSAGTPARSDGETGGRTFRRAEKPPTRFGSSLALQRVLR